MWLPLRVTLLSRNSFSRVFHRKSPVEKLRQRLKGTLQTNNNGNDNRVGGALSSLGDSTTTFLSLSQPALLENHSAPKSWQRQTVADFAGSTKRNSQGSSTNHQMSASMAEVCSVDGAREQNAAKASSPVTSSSQQQQNQPPAVTYETLKKKKMRHKKLQKILEAHGELIPAAEERARQHLAANAGRPGKKRVRRMQQQQESLSEMDLCLLCARNAVFTGSVVLDSGSNGGAADDHEEAGGLLNTINHSNKTSNEAKGDEKESSSSLQEVGKRILNISTVGSFAAIEEGNKDEPQNHIYVQPLLVLDLNGILCHRFRRERAPAGVPLSAYREATAGNIARTPIIPRTDLSDFLYFLDRHFCVGVWTSAKNRTATALVKTLFPQEVANRLLFVWAQHNCDIGDSASAGSGPLTSDTETSGAEDGNNSSPLFEKDLSKVWKKYPLWNASNTVLMDDSPKKCTQWHENAIHPPPLHGQLGSWNGMTDTENEKRQRAFFEGLVHFWERNSLIQTWDEESGDATTFLKSHGQELELLNSQNGLLHYLKVHAVGHMGWK